MGKSYLRVTITHDQGIVEVKVLAVINQGNSVSPGIVISINLFQQLR